MRKFREKSHTIYNPGGKVSLVIKQESFSGEKPLPELNPEEVSLEN